MREASNYLAVINNPNTVGFGCGYVRDGFKTIGGTGNTSALPNFIESYFDSTWKASRREDHQLSFNSTRVCIGDSTSFNIINSTGYPLLWDFDDILSGSSNISTLNNPKHLFLKQENMR